MKISEFCAVTRVKSPLRWCWLIHSRKLEGLFDGWVIQEGRKWLSFDSIVIGELWTRVEDIALTHVLADVLGHAVPKLTSGKIVFQADLLKDGPLNGLQLELVTSVD